MHPGQRCLLFQEDKGAPRRPLPCRPAALLPCRRLLFQEDKRVGAARNHHVCATAACVRDRRVWWPPQEREEPEEAMSVLDHGGEGAAGDGEAAGGRGEAVGTERVNHETDGEEEEEEEEEGVPDEPLPAAFLR